MPPLIHCMAAGMHTCNVSTRARFSHICSVALLRHHFGQSPKRPRPEMFVDDWGFVPRKKQPTPGLISIAASARRSVDGITLLRGGDSPVVLPTARQPRKLRLFLSFDNAGGLLGCLTSTMQRAVLTACYSGGLRISATVNLRPANVCNGRIVAYTMPGERRKVRDFMLLRCLLENIRDHRDSTRNEGKWLFSDLMLGHQLGSGAVERADQKGCALSGIAKQIRPGLLRPGGVSSSPSGTGIADDGHCLPCDEGAA